MAVAPRRPMRKCVSRPLLDGPEHGGTLGRVGIKPGPGGVRPADLYNEHNTTRGGARFQWPAIVATYLHAADQTWIHTMMQIRIGSEAPKQRRPFLYSA
jgi:hypothetical protein